MIVPVQNKSKQRQCCFLPEDADAFSEALRVRWPTIAFQVYEYWDNQKRPGDSNESWKNVPEVPTLSKSGQILTRVWVKPEGWEPEWSEKRNKGGIFRIENFPNLTFVYHKSGRMLRYTHLPDWDERQPEKSESPVDIRAGRIWAVYDKSDEEVQQFLNAVWRIAAKLSTNLVDVVDMKTGKIYPGRRTTTWCGYHALDWCRQDPRRVLDGNLRPAG